jgi:hypothetical protein
MFMGKGRKRELLRNKNQWLQQRHWNYDHNTHPIVMHCFMQGRECKLRSSIKIMHKQDGAFSLF